MSKFRGKMLLNNLKFKFSYGWGSFARVRATLTSPKGDKVSWEQIGSIPVCCLSERLSMSPVDQIYKNRLQFPPFCHMAIACSSHADPGCCCELECQKHATAHGHGQERSLYPSLKTAELIPWCLRGDPEDASAGEASVNRSKSCLNCSSRKLACSVFRLGSVKDEPEWWWLTVLHCSCLYFLAVCIHSHILTY